LSIIDELIESGNYDKIYQHAVVDKSGDFLLYPLSVAYSTRVDREFGGGRLLSVSFVDLKDLKLEFDLCGRKYTFLCATSSSLRSNRVIYWCESGYDITKNISCGEIRRWTGVTPKSCSNSVAKYVSRLGLSLSSTIPTIKLQMEQIEIIDDIKRNGYEFTDGCGFISEDLMKKVQEVMELKFLPSVIQVRLGMHNVKGILVISNTIHNRIQIRSSMTKNVGLPLNPTDAQLTLEICINGYSSYQYSSANLNKEFILNMWSNGIPESYFINEFETYLRESTINTTKIENLQQTIAHSSPDSFEFKAWCMLVAGFEESEPQLANYVHFIQDQKIKKVTENEKIKIPISKCKCLYGIPDPCGVLKEGEMYGQLVNENRPREKTTILGRAWISKPPCIHAGDGRIVTFVDKPELRYLRNVIVFSTQGDRPLSNMIGGSDHDGDQYFVIWDTPEITDNFKDFTPGVYDKINSLTKSLHIADSISETELVSKMKSYIEQCARGKFLLGKISCMHESIGSVLTTRNNVCLELAKLHSRAVDAVKTGDFPWEMPPSIDKLHNACAEKSDTILKKLLNVAKQIKTELDMTKESWKTQGKYDADILSLTSTDDSELESAEIIMKRFNHEIAQEIKTEDINQRRELGELRENKYRHAFMLRNPIAALDGDDSDDYLELDALLKRAAIWYRITCQNNKQAFAWVVWDYLCMLKATITSRKLSDNGFVGVCIPHEMLEQVLFKKF
jgi:hypothetical protein